MASVKEKVWELAKADFDKMLSNDELLDMWLKAHNRYQEDECDGVDYIFDLRSPEDLIDCIKGGLTARELAALEFTQFCGEDAPGTDYFLFGQNYGRPKRLSRVQLCNFIYSRYDCVLCKVMRYPHIEEYKKLYELYVLPNLL